MQLAVHGFTELTESCPEHISLFALHVFGNAWKLLRHPCVPTPNPIRPYSHAYRVMQSGVSAATLR